MYVKFAINTRVTLKLTVSFQISFSTEILHPNIEGIDMKLLEDDKNKYSWFKWEQPDYQNYKYCLNALCMSWEGCPFTRYLESYLKCH